MMNNRPPPLPVRSQSLDSDDNLSLMAKSQPASSMGKAGLFVDRNKPMPLSTQRYFSFGSVFRSHTPKLRRKSAAVDDLPQRKGTWICRHCSHANPTQHDVVHCALCGFDHRTRPSTAPPLDEIECDPLRATPTRSHSMPVRARDLCSSSTISSHSSIRRSWSADDDTEFMSVNPFDSPARTPLPRQVTPTPPEPERGVERRSSCPSQLPAAGASYNDHWGFIGRGSHGID